MNAVRRVLDGAGAPVRMILIACIKVYRVSLSGWLGGQCRFYPSCSRYAEDAIRVHGAAKGSWMALWRVLRCSPFGRGGVDRVDGDPTGEPYDDVAHGASDQKARV
ncbi:MAG: membrane protein insertion efficiency factor YidD [Actinomycetota bacterium]|nr:membrane protein insertion efficiency factor YidD [Actinomycetota bacterium]